MEWEEPEFNWEEIDREIRENQARRTVVTIPQRLPLPDEPVARRPGEDVLSLDHRCWRCGGMGHRRAACRRTAILFCSGCGKPGVLSRNCCRRPYDPPEIPRALMSNPPPLPSPVTYSPVRSVGIQCRLLAPPAPPCPTCGGAGTPPLDRALPGGSRSTQGTQTVDQVCSLPSFPITQERATVALREGSLQPAPPSRHDAERRESTAAGEDRPTATPRRTVASLLAALRHRRVGAEKASKAEDA